MFYLFISYCHRKFLCVTEDVFFFLDGISGEKLGTVLGGRKGTEDSHIGHTSHIYSIAISSDGKFLVSYYSLNYVTSEI